MSTPRPRSTQRLGGHLIVERREGEGRGVRPVDDGCRHRRVGSVRCDGLGVLGQFEVEGDEAAAGRGQDVLTVEGGAVGPGHAPHGRCEVLAAESPISRRGEGRPGRGSSYGRLHGGARSKCGPSRVGQGGGKQKHPGSQADERR